MSALSIARSTTVLASLGILILLAGCSGQQLSSSVGDESMMEGPSAEVGAAEPAPEPFAATEPEVEETYYYEETYMGVEPEAGVEEAFVWDTEPMVEAVPEPEFEESYLGEPEFPMGMEMEPGPLEEEFAPESEPQFEEPFMAEPEPGPMEEEMVAAVEPEPMIEEFQPEPELKSVSLDNVYFDFDRFSIRSDARITLETNARRLREQDDLTITIEGHCDERGTIAYNLVLGERRADTAMRYLIGLGIPEHRIHIVSYGKERPVCSESEEGCWQLNRRAHFAY